MRFLPPGPALSLRNVPHDWGAVVLATTKASIAKWSRSLLRMGGQGQNLHSWVSGARTYIVDSRAG